MTKNLSHLTQKLLTTKGEGCKRKGVWSWDVAVTHQKSHLRGKGECSETGPSCWWCLVVLCLRRHSQPPASPCPFCAVSSNEQQSLKAGGAWAWLPSLTPVWSRANGSKEQNWTLLSFCTHHCVINDKVLSFCVQATGAKCRGEKGKKI